MLHILESRANILQQYTKILKVPEMRDTTFQAIVLAPVLLLEPTIEVGLCSTSPITIRAYQWDEAMLYESSLPGIEWILFSRNYLQRPINRQPGFRPRTRRAEAKS